MLHKVFDFSKDKLIFDVSHQSYVHKLLSGRIDKFETLRKYNGLSGFQKLSEEDDYEALNHIGEVNTKFIIILNDNEMSINKNVGALHNHLDKLRSSKNYLNTKDKTKSFLSKIPFIGEKLVKFIKSIKLSIKKLYLKDGFIFEELGLKYYGPINGHDFDELKKNKRIKKSVLVHVITEKVLGYKYSENDTSGKWHGVSPFNKDSEEATNLINTAINNSVPFVIRYSKNKVKYTKKEISSIEVGSWQMLKEGSIATLITYKDFVSESEYIIDKLKMMGIA